MQNRGKQKSKKTQTLDAFLEQRIKIQQSSTETDSPNLQTLLEIQSLPHPNYSKSSAIKKPKLTFNKPTPKPQEVQIRNDDIGETAEWAELGTKNIDVDFDGDQQHEEPFEPKVIADIDVPVYDKEAIRLKMEEKVKKLIKGELKGPTSSNPTRLLNKARGIKQQKQKASPRKIVEIDITAPNIASSQPQPQRIDTLKSDANKIAYDNDSQQQDNKWNNINQQTIVHLQNHTKNKKLIYTTEEVRNYYSSLNLREQKKLMKIQNLSGETIKSQFSFFSCMTQKKSINGDVKSQLLALTKVYISEDIDVFLLESIWKSLTHKHFMRFGNHWQEVGFQGHDPSTDLRSTGILSLLLIFFYKEQHQQNFKQFHTFSRNQQIDFPLMITMIKIVGKFTDLINKNYVYGKNLQEYLQWYYALNHHMIKTIQSQKFNISTIGQGVTKILNKIQSKMGKIKKQYRELH